MTERQLDGQREERRMVELWRHGGTPQPAAQAGAVAKRLEDLGWDGLVIGEDNGIIPDPYVYLAYAGACTTRLRLGSGVAVPLRHPLLAANAIATLHAMTGGRTLFSFGRGDGAMAQLGMRGHTVHDFERYMTQLQAYLARDEVTIGEFTSTLQRLFELDPSLDVPKPPVDISATGPRMVAMSARVAESITFAVGADAARLAELVEQARGARAAAGLDPATLQLGCYVPAAVAADGVTVAEAREIVRGAVLRHARFSAFDGTALADVPDELKAGVLKAVEVTRDHGKHRPKKADFSLASVLDDEFVDRFAIIGSPARCAERLQELIAAGVDRIVLLTRVPTTDPGEGNAARLAQTVFPLVR
jgi:5,10-methylenetetrahydromethanopterin reductase